MKNAKRLLALVLSLVMAFGCFTTAFAAVTEKTETETNDSAATANSFDIATDKMTGKLATSSDVDFFAFKAKDAGAVKVTIEHAKKESESSYFVVDIFDSSIASDNTAKAKETFASKGTETSSVSTGFPVKAGETYYIRVTRGTVHDDALAYTVSAAVTATKATMETEDNNSITDANKITLSSRTDTKKQYLYTGIIDNDADVDYFVLETSKNSILNIFLYNEDSNSTGAFKATLIKAVGAGTGSDLSEKSFAQVQVPNKEAKKISSDICVAKDTFYLKVEGLNGGTGSYSFKIQAADSAAQSATVNGTEAEYNNIKTYANEIFMNLKTGMEGASYDKTDVDCYRFVVVASFKAKALKFEITNKDTTKATATWILALETSDGDPLATKEVNKATAAEFKMEEFKEKINPADVVYLTISVKDGDPADAKYKLTFTDIEQKKEEDDNKKDQNPFERFIQILKDTIFNGDTKLWSGIWEVIIAVPIKKWIQTGIELIKNAPLLTEIIKSIVGGFVK